MTDPCAPEPNWVPPLLPYPSVSSSNGAADQAKEPTQPLELQLLSPEVPPPAGVLGLCPIESVRIQARMLLRPWVSYTVGDEFLCLYANCEAISETWVNVTITAEQLGEMLAAILVTRPNYEPAALDVLRAICKRY